MENNRKDIAQLGPLECIRSQEELDPDEGIIEYIFKGGQGEEAVVTVELRTVIPGIRQVIKTKEGIVTAVRREKYPEPGLGHTMFLKNMLIKKFDDYFTWTGIYKYSHIPRAFGSISLKGKNPCESCFYEWFAGEEGFPWKAKGDSDILHDIRLHDWETFIERFREAGIVIGEDCFDLQNRNYSKNIIHQFPFYNRETYDMNVIWKRIDYGEKSIRIDFDQCAVYLSKKSHTLKEQLRPERFDMMELTVQYLSQKERMPESDLKLLMNYVQDYRVKSVDHYISHGTSLGGQLLYLDENESRMQYL
ncbi:hypothetical protein LLG96_07960 [bacterium]|nr:hypothetical protein [bacterium]